MELEEREMVLCSAGAKGRSSSSSWDCRLPRRSSLFNRPLLIFPRHNHHRHQHHERFCILLAFLCSLFLTSGSVLGSSLHYVPDIENAMYQTIDGAPCVRLLHLNGEIGCANPGRGKVQAPVQRFMNSTIALKTKTTVVLPALELHQFLERTVNDPWLAEQVTAVLVEFTNNTSVFNSGFSPDTTFPQSEFAPYEPNYSWNPAGSGILKRRFNFPVFLLSEESTASVLEVAAENGIRNLKHPLYVAEFDFVMQTTKSGTQGSESCLKEWSCLPLGGYSVWSSLSPIDMSVPSERPILLVVASMDSASIFRDLSTGADSSLSGMIALLAAVDALSKVADIGQFQKEVVFLVFTGEAWGYLGSRRFLAELEAGGPSVAGLSDARIQQILEVGSVGRGVHSHDMTLFAHTQDSQVSASTREILEALKTSASSLAGGKEVYNVEVKLANEQNPGIPPSSLMSFVQKESTIAGIVLEDFDQSFENRFYHSHLDSTDNINTTSVASTAALIARSVYLLGNSAANLTSLQSILVNDSLVDNLVHCLLSRSGPGMTCDLVTSLITPTEQYANHYVGVVIGNPSETPYVGNIDDTARFTWNFLASRTGTLRRHGTDENVQANVSTLEECTETCKSEDEICVASTRQQKGHCILSTTRYVPAYSPRLRYETYGWRLIPATPGDIMSEVDPVWTESYWKSLTVRLFLEESSRHDEIILTWGLAMTVGSFLAIATSKAVLCRRLKRD
ncbi:unnamed protein product [Calypogeia fissa]